MGYNTKPQVKYNLQSSWLELAQLLESFQLAALENMYKPEGIMKGDLIS